MTFTIGQPTKVRFHVWVLGLDSIDEGSMVRCFFCSDFHPD